jgi:hypothetical protein
LGWFTAAPTLKTDLINTTEREVFVFAQNGWTWLNSVKTWDIAHPAATRLTVSILTVITSLPIAAGLLGQSNNETAERVALLLSKIEPKI